MTASNPQSTNSQELAAYHASDPGAGGNGMSATQDVGTGLNAVGNGLAVYQGLQKGGVTGYGSAAINGANMANNVSKLTGNGALISGPASGALGAAGGALQLYNGLKQGGALGYTNAALGAANTAAGIGTLAGGASAGGLGSLAAAAAYTGPLAIALAPVLYGMSQPPWLKNGDYTNRMNGYLNAGPGQFASTQGFNGSYWDPQYMNYQAALQDKTGTDWTSLVNSGAVPFAPGVTGGGGGVKQTSNK